MPILLLLLSLTGEPTSLSLKLPKLERAEVHEAYQAWLRSCQNRQPVEIEFRRIEYDTVFRVERHWTGRFAWKNELEWTYSSEPVNVRPGTSGGRFPVAKGDSEHIVATKVFVTLNGQRFPRGGNNPLMPRDPSLFLGRPGPKPLAAENVWAFLKKETDATAQFVVHPKRPPVNPEWQVLHVVWDKKQARPYAVKVDGPAGTTETVYTIKSWKPLDGDIAN